MDNLRLDLTNLIRVGPRAAWKELINLVLEDFTATSDDTSAAPGAGLAAAGEVVPLRGTTRTDLNIVLSGSLPRSTNAGDACVFGKALVDSIGNKSHSKPSASDALNAPFLAGSDEDKPVAIGQGFHLLLSREKPLVPRRLLRVPVPSVASSIGDTGSTLLTKQSSAAATYNRTAESTSPPESDYGSIKRSGLRRNLRGKRGSKTIKKSEKLDCRSKFVASLGRLKLRFRSFRLQLQRLVRLPVPRPLVTFPSIRRRMKVRSRFLPSPFIFIMVILARRKCDFCR